MRLARVLAALLLSAGQGGAWAAAAPPHHEHVPPDEGATPAEDEGATPAVGEGATPAEDEGATPAEDEGARPAVDEGATPTVDEGAGPAVDEGATPAVDEAASAADAAGRDLSPPRAGRGLGVGLGVGLGGLASLVVGWMSEGGLSVEVAVGLIYPVLDTRVRWYGVEHALTPVVGLGMLTSLGHEDRLGVDVADLDRLYDLGEHVHVDLGLAWAITREVEVFGGVAFTTSLDRDHVDAVTFFPVATGQVSCWF